MPTIDYGDENCDPQIRNQSAKGGRMNKELFQYLFELLARDENMTARERENLAFLCALMDSEK